MNDEMALSRPDGATPVRVRVPPGLCEAWGTCHRWAPEVHPSDDAGRVDVHLLEVPADVKELRDAVAELADRSGAG